MLLSLAWRNIWRNRRRSVIIVAAIVLGLVGGLFIAGFSEGMIAQVVESTINRELGHVQIHAPGFIDDQAITQSIPHADSIAALARSQPGVTRVVTRALIVGMIASPVTSQGITLMGVDPDDEREMTNVASTLIDGIYLDRTPANGIVIGKRLARKLDARLKSKLVVSFAGPDGTIIYFACRVAGIFETESSVYDDRTVLVRRADLAPLLGGPIAHEITLRVATIDLVDSVAVRLRSVLPALQVQSWKERSPVMKLYTDLTGFYLTLILGIVLFALLFGITNTMLMSVLDRVHEFGVLLAVGMRRRRLYGLVFLESLLLSLTGGAAGSALGAALVAWLHRTGLSLQMFSEGFALYGMSSTIYPAIPAAFYPELALMVSVTAILAALYPGWKAVHLKPAEAIRG